MQDADGNTWHRYCEFGHCWCKDKDVDKYYMGLREQAERRRMALNARRKAKGKKPISLKQYAKRREKYLNFCKLDNDEEFGEFLRTGSDMY